MRRDQKRQQTLIEAGIKGIPPAMIREIEAFAQQDDSHLSKEERQAQYAKKFRELARTYGAKIPTGGAP